jgi:hypothetical protein
MFVLETMHITTNLSKYWSFPTSDEQFLLTFTYKIQNVKDGETLQIVHIFVEVII